MRTLPRTFASLVAGVCILGFCALSVDAQDAVMGPVRKLGRGLCNAAFGATEILIQGYDVNQAEGALACYTYGVFRGIAFFLVREGVGVFEIATFPVPFPGLTDSKNETGWGYAPILKPEWIIDPQHDPYNLIYQDFPPD